MALSPTERICCQDTTQSGERPHRPDHPRDASCPETLVEGLPQRLWDVTGEVGGGEPLYRSQHTPWVGKEPWGKNSAIRGLSLRIFTAILSC